MDRHRLERIRELVQDSSNAVTANDSPAEGRSSDGGPLTGVPPGRFSSVRLRVGLAVVGMALVVGGGALGWSWWKAGAYRREAEKALAGSIVAIEYQPHALSAYVVLRNPSDIAIVKQFLLDARERPDLGPSPGRPMAVYGPDCGMKIRFVDGRTETLALGVTLPYTAAYRKLLVVRANSEIAWRGYRRYGAADQLGMLYRRLAQTNTLVFGQPAINQPPGASGESLGPLAQEDRLGALGRGGRTLGVAGARPGSVDCGRFVRRRLLCGSARFASEGHRYLHVGFRRGGGEEVNIGYVRVVDAQTGSIVGRVEVPFPPQNVVGSALASQGDRVAVAIENITTHRTRVEVVDVASGKTLCELADYDGNQTYPEFGPDGTRLALAWYSPETGVQVGLYDATSGRALSSQTYLPGSNGVPAALAFSPDGRRLLVHGEKTVVYGTETGDPRYQVKDVDHWAGAAFSSDGRTLHVVSNSLELMALDASSGKKLRSTAYDLDHRILALASSPDGAILAVSLADGTVRLLSSTTLAQRAGWKGEGEPPLRGTGALAFSPDGTHLLVRTRDFGARIIDLATGREVLHVPPPSRDDQPEGAGQEHREIHPLLHGRAFSGDGRFLLLSFPFDELTKREGCLMLLGLDSDPE
jgi:hypothetical protein